MAPRKKCAICGSRQWRKNAIGLVTCSEGHVLQNYINESEEADDVGTHVMRKRTLKSSRKKNERASRADPKLYHGDRARFHYYQCLQLLFRKQVAALMTIWNLPSEFETICRDLWALHLNTIPSPPPAEPFYYTRDQEGYQSELEEVGKKDDSRHTMESIAPVRDGDPYLSDEIFAPEIAVLLEENSEVSSSEDGPSGGESHVRSDKETLSKNPFVGRADRPENTVAVLVLACWTIRLPVVYMDFIGAIESHSLPYLDVVRSLPLTLTRHLTKHAAQALSPHHAPKTLSLHRLASRLASRLYEAFDIVIPELNTAPVLWRVVQECFYGTPILYAMTKRVGNMLSVGLSLQGSSAPLLSGVGGEADSQRHDSVPPEVSLCAVSIVVLKLVYGLDGKERHPTSSDDIACAFPAASEYLAEVRAVDRVESCANGHQFGSQVTLPVGDLDDATLDKYLNFCQRVLVERRKDGHRVVDKFFPLADGAHTNPKPDERPGPRRRGFSSTRVDDENLGGLEPGELYAIYDAKDVLGNISGDLQTVAEKSARWAGIECDVLWAVVERYERRLVRWWGDRQQGQRGTDSEPG